jgi:tRNA nucleotidyltransferase (CCA-adding enzyme)
MEIYRVGGAVRDKLLNYPSHENDWVVIGSTPEEMIKLGYRQVGKDFPVFLHPKTHDEYALARTERKTGQGYTGFTCHSSPDITLEEDLLRRDLTINAIAEDAQGKIIDPFGGCQDLDNRILRHVSAAFSEDPLRILRIARFAARYHHLGFKVADQTLELLKEMVRAGQAKHLIAERVWQELTSSLTERSPEIFFQVLKDCGALAIIFPELEPVFREPANPPPLALSVGLYQDAAICFAVLTYNIDSSQTETLDRINALTARLRAPNLFTELARLTALHHQQCRRALSLNAQSLYEIIEASDALRKPDRFKQLLQCCHVIELSQLETGTSDINNEEYPPAKLLLSVLRAAKGYDVNSLVKAGFKGKALGDQLREKRIEVIGQLIRTTT